MAFTTDHPSSNRRGYMDVLCPTALLRVQRRGKPSSGIQQQTCNAIKALRLISSGFVRILSEKHYAVHYKQQVGMCNEIEFPQNQLLGNNFTLNESDRRWMHNLLKLLWQPLNEGCLEGEETPIAIAYQRYRDAIKPWEIEKIITSAIMGLESLFLSDDSMSELSRTLRMRAAKLLSYIGIDSTEIEKDLKSGYQDRSRYVHGGMILSKRKTKLKREYGILQNYTRRIREYLRLSIILFISANKSAKEINKTIDLMLLGKDENEFCNTIKPYIRAIKPSINLPPKASTC